MSSSSSIDVSWEPRVNEILKGADISSLLSLESAINEIRCVLLKDVDAASNFRGAGNKSLPSLREACTSFPEPHSPIISYIRDCALAALSITDLLSSIPTLDHPGSAALSLHHVHSLLCLNFFCALPKKFCAISLYRLYSRDGDGVAVARIQCFLEYFRKCSENAHLLQGALTVERRKLNWQNDKAGSSDTAKFTSPDWESLDSVVQPAILSSDKIEDATAEAHVDFANRLVHIGRIAASATQEEVVFSIRPHLFVVMLIAGTPMDDDEAIIISGAKRFCTYTGYLNTFRFAHGVEPESNPPCIIAIDAIVNTFADNQFGERSIVRDLNKAWLGFVPYGRRRADLESAPWRVSTGQWGCGVFGGDPVLKFLQQLMAANAANARLVFSVYGNRNLAKRLKDVNDMVKGRSIREVFGMLRKFRSVFR